MDLSLYSTQSIDQVARELKVNLKSGISSNEAVLRAQTYGRNLVASEKITWPKILIRQFKSPFVYLLVAAGLLALFLGEWIDGVFIAAFILINAALSFYQEYKSEHALRLLSQYVEHRSQVLRDGTEVVINSNELVPGDLIILEPGDIIPADVRLVVVDNFTIDESVLTGEAVPQIKSIEVLEVPPKEIWASSNLCFTGTTVVSGRAEGVVINIGTQTALGEVSKLVSETSRRSSFAQDMGRFSKFVLKLTLITLVGVVVANLIIKGASVNLPDLLIFAVALAVSVIPEGLPVVTTFSLAHGALRLAKHKVVVKRLSAIEDLGRIEVLCTDKTGTLTENKLTLAEVYAPEMSRTEVLFRAAAVAPPIQSKQVTSNNAFDLSLWGALAEKDKKDIDDLKRLIDIPFDPHLKYHTSVWQRGKKIELVRRGAAEVLIKSLSKRAAEKEEELNTWVKAQGVLGRRVLVITQKNLKVAPADNKLNELKDFSLVGAVSFVDPIKSTTHEAVKTAGSLGVKMKMLTGDSAEVAGAVAKEVGLVSDASKVLTGEQFWQLSPLEQRRAAENYSVFARLNPEQKFRLIEILERKYTVGFLGEGINDAPALKVANVGMVVSDASDIAREAADIVLLQKSLHVIIDGIKEGRLVFANTVKYIKATMTSNFGNFYAVAVASLLVDFLPMLPVQLLLLNLLSDFPMMAIASDTVDASEIAEPHSYNLRDITLFTVLIGVVSTVFDFIFFGLFYRQGAQVLQTNWFIASILTELAFLFSVRTKLPLWRTKAPSLIIILLTASATIITIILPFIPISQSWFGFITPKIGTLGLILGIVLVYLVITELAKLSYYKYFSHHKSNIKSVGHSQTA